VPWRQWGDVAAARQALEALAPPANFLVHHGEVRDMRAYYAGCHATVVSFADGSGKACPNFVLEGFASGRPCLTTPGSGIARQVTASGAGIVVDRDAAALAAAIDRLQAGWAGYAARARALAEGEFGLGRFLSQYERLYADILEESRGARRERVPGHVPGSARPPRGVLEESGKERG
jgi:glycosyltransferase involved in cell wall biosynthesis